MRKPDTRFRPAPQSSALELLLRLEDGTDWRLRFSAGMQRFVGHYPLVEGLGCDGPLLSFRSASAD
ncbi:MAG TPA: hypothetical protein VF645_05505 [Allosphingosinicella sp.]|jgi:hypothetical protein